MQGHVDITPAIGRHHHSTRRGGLKICGMASPRKGGDELHACCHTCAHGRWTSHLHRRIGLRGWQSRLGSDSFGQDRRDVLLDWMYESHNRPRWGFGFRIHGSSRADLGLVVGATTTHGMPRLHLCRHQDDYQWCAIAAHAKEALFGHRLGSSGLRHGSSATTCGDRLRPGARGTPLERSSGQLGQGYGSRDVRYLTIATTSGTSGG